MPAWSKNTIRVVQPEQKSFQSRHYYWFNQSWLLREFILWIYHSLFNTILLHKHATSYDGTSQELKEVWTSARQVTRKSEKTFSDVLFCVSEFTRRTVLWSVSTSHVKWNTIISCESYDLPCCYWVTINYTVNNTWKYYLQLILQIARFCRVVIV